MAYKPSIGQHASGNAPSAHRAQTTPTTPEQIATDAETGQSKGNRIQMILFVAALIAIIIIAIVVRMGLAKYSGLFEPDGFFYYTVMRATIENNFLITYISPLSGFPNHNSIGESPGLIYLTVVPYYFLRYAGISYYTIMRLLPVVFGVLEVIVAYYIGREVINKRGAGLLAAFFVAVSSGNVARTAALVYRGDSFITPFLMLALLFGLKALKGKLSRLTYIYAFLSAFSLSVGLVVWNGSPFAVAMYLLAIYVLVIYGFIKSNKELLLKVCVLTGMLLLTYLLWHVYVYAGVAKGGEYLYGADFFIFYAPLIVFGAAAYYMIAHDAPKRIVSTSLSRFETLAVIGAIALVVVWSIFGSYLDILLSIRGGSFSSTHPIGSTTQETQAPTWNFLLASFSYQFYFVWIGIALPFVLAFYYSRKGEGPRAVNMDGSAFLVVLVYFMITFYLQSKAIRWNSLVSIPIAILSAVGLYVIWALIKEGVGRREKVFIYLGVLAVTVLAVYFSGSGLYVFGVLIVYIIVGLFQSKESVVFKPTYAYLGFLAILFALELNISYVQSYSSAQADGINPLFLDAMSWMSVNTPKNATVLALWPDGSVVEGWGNRTSYMDSVGGEIESRIWNFSRYLFNTTLDANYLYDSAHKPMYLVARNYWLNELAGIAIEGGVPNATAFGYNILDTANVTSNSTQKEYIFSSSAPPYYGAKFILYGFANGSSGSYAAIHSGNSQYQEIQHAILYNAANYSYMILNYTNALQNYTLFITYAGNSITGASILGPKLPYSNLFRFVFLCNAYSCEYNSNSVNIRAVYKNDDTSILKIDYLHD